MFLRELAAPVGDGALSRRRVEDGCPAAAGLAVRCGERRPGARGRTAGACLERVAYLSTIASTSRADKIRYSSPEYFTLLGLLLGGVRDDQAGGRGLLGFERADDNAVFEWLDADRHVLDLTFHGMREA